MALIAQLAATAGSEGAIPAGEFKPYWRRALNDLLTSYNRTCAYLSLHIPRAVGTPSSDHMVAKSTAWDQVYEWSNYRLACLLMNARKGIADVLDPFEIDDGWFALELVAFQVVPGHDLPINVHARVVETNCHFTLERQRLLRGAGRVRTGLLGRRGFPVLPAAMRSVRGKGAGASWSADDHGASLDTLAGQSG